MSSLLDFGIIPIDYTSLRSIYPAHKSLNDKISDLEKQIFLSLADLLDLQYRMLAKNHSHPLCSEILN